jgi:hypothetical protein
MAPDTTSTDQVTATETDDGLSTWDDVRRVADELALKMHLASMGARDRWRELEPKLEAIEREITLAGRRMSQSILHELASVRQASQHLRDEVAPKN